jgi:hypothetical protein
VVEEEISKLMKVFGRHANTSGPRTDKRVCLPVRPLGAAQAGCAASVQRMQAHYVFGGEAQWLGLQLPLSSLATVLLRPDKPAPMRLTQPPLTTRRCMSTDLPAARRPCAARHAAL